MNFFQKIKKALADQDHFMKKSEENIDELRATINGEDWWFRVWVDNEEIKLKCRCEKEVDKNDGRSDNR